MMHKKIMEKTSEALAKDAKHYKEDAKKTHSDIKRRNDLVEEKEASSAAKLMKIRAKKAHEF